MKRTFLLFTFALLVLSRSADAQIGFDFVVDQGASVTGAAGSTVQITGHVTLSATAGVGGWTCGFETRTPDGLEFCINTSTESTGPADKEALIQTVDTVNGNSVQTAGVLALFPDPTTFIIQNAGEPHAQCEASGDAGSTPDDSQNNGRRGVVDSTVLNIGQSLTEINGLLIFPFAVDCVVPSDEAGLTLELAFVGRTGGEEADRLKGPGQPVANGVSQSGATVSADSLGVVSINIAPQPFIVGFAASLTDASAVVGGASSGGDGVLTVSGAAATSGEGVAALSFSVSLTGPDSVDVQSAGTHPDLLGALSNVSALAFESFHVSGDGGVDASEVYNDEGDADCGLSDGAAQGKGLVVGQVFALELTGAGETLPPSGSTNAVSFSVGGDNFADTADDGASLCVDFVNCIRGPGARIKNSATVLGQTVAPASVGGACATLTVVAAGEFLRCDPNEDGKNDIADAVWLISALFRTGPQAAWRDSADCDNDGSAGTLGDISFAIGYQFMGGSAPAEPFSACGVDDSADPATCPPASHAACP